MVQVLDFILPFLCTHGLGVCEGQLFIIQHCDPVCGPSEAWNSRA